MLRHVHVPLLALVFLFPLAAPAQDTPPVVEGTLVGHDGTALPVSHVHVHPYDNDRARSLSVGPDSSFRASLDTTGVVTLRFTGQNHEMKAATVLASPGDTIGVDVRLGTFPKPDSLSPMVTGAFNDFSTREGAIPMTKRDDGTYVATVPSPKDSLTYGVANASPDGTQMDRLTYAGHGNYRPVIASPLDSTTVVYDPTAIPRSDTEPTVQFRDPTSTAARYAAFVEDVEARREAFFNAMRTAENPQARRAISDTFDWSPNRKQLERALSKDRPTRIENAYRAAYLDNTLDADSIMAKEILTTIPAASPLWSMAGLSGTIRAAGGLDAHEDFAYKALRENPSDAVTSRLVGLLLRKAAKNDEEEKQKLLYAWMEAEYADTPMARIARSRYAPDRAIQVGKPVPRFEVSALRDTSKTFTPASFEGQYVLLDFWATWCAPCIQELPTLRTADSTYSGNDFTILSLSFDDARSTVTDFLQDRDMPWKHAFVEGGFESEIANQFEVVGIPKPILVGPNGQIVATESDLRGEDLMKTLEKHLGPSAEGSASN